MNELSFDCLYIDRLVFLIFCVSILCWYEINLNIFSYIFVLLFFIDVILFSNVTYCIHCLFHGRWLLFLVQKAIWRKYFKYTTKYSNYKYYDIVCPQNLWFHPWNIHVYFLSLSGCCCIICHSCWYCRNYEYISALYGLLSFFSRFYLDH